MISLKHDIARIGRNAGRIEKQLPFATALAITRTAQIVQKDEIKEMRDVFDRPTPYTLRSTYMQPATKKKLRAEVGIKDEATEAVPPVKFLTPEIRGGGRRLKTFERALRSVGALPNGYVAVPGTGAKLDAYGNISRGQIVQILSFFKTNGLAGFNFNATPDSLKRRSNRAAKKAGAQSVTYFVGRPGDGKLPLGIWQRFTFAGKKNQFVSRSVGSAIKPILIFVPFAIYQARFDFQYVGQLAVRNNFARELSKAIATAIRGAIK